MYAEAVDFGIMFNQITMMNMRTVLPTKETGIKFCMNIFHKEISIEFPMLIVDPRATSNDPNMQRGKYDRTELFQFRIPFTQLKVIYRIAGQGHKFILLISMETLPKFFKQLDPSKSHDDKAATWGDNDAWYRQTDLVYAPNGLKKSSLTWKKTNPIIDLGKHYSFAQDPVIDLSKDAGLPIAWFSIVRRKVFHSSTRCVKRYATIILRLCLFLTSTSPREATPRSGSSSTYHSRNEATQEPAWKS